MGSRDKVWNLPFCEVFDVLGYRFHRDGKGFQGAERTMCKALRSWWRDKYIHRAKTVPMMTKCKRDRSHVYSTALNGSINWPWSGALILRLTFRPRMRPDETWVGYKIRTSRSTRISWRKMGLPLLIEKFASKIWTAMTWAVYDGDVVEKPVLLGHGVGPLQRSKMEAQGWVSQPRSSMGRTDGEVMRVGSVTTEPLSRGRFQKHKRSKHREAQRDGLRFLDDASGAPPSP